MGLVYYDRSPVEEENSSGQQSGHENTAVIGLNGGDSVTNDINQNTTGSNSSSSSGGGHQTPAHDNSTAAPLANQLNFTNVSIASGDGQPGVSSSDINVQPQQHHSVTFSEVASVYEPSSEFEFTSNNIQTYRSSSNHTNEPTIRRRGRRRSVRTSNRHDGNEHESGYISNRSSRSNSRHSQSSNTEGVRPGILRRSRSASRRSSSSISSAATTMSSTVATHLNTYANSAIFYDDDDADDDDEVTDNASFNDNNQQGNASSSSNNNRIMVDSTDNESIDAATDDAISIPLNGNNVNLSQNNERFGSESNENVLETLQNTLINSTIERDFSDIITSASHQRTMSPPPPPPPEEIDVYRASEDRSFGGLHGDFNDSHFSNSRVLSDGHTIQLENDDDEDEAYYRSFSEGDEFNNDLMMGEVRSLNILDRDSVRIYNGYNNVLRFPLNHNRRIRIHRANRQLPGDNAYQDSLNGYSQTMNEQSNSGMELVEEEGNSGTHRKIDQPSLFHYCNAFYDIFAKVKNKLIEKNKYSKLVWRLNEFTKIFEKAVISKSLTVPLIIDGIWLSDSLVRLSMVKKHIECHRNLSIVTYKAVLFVKSVDDKFEFNTNDEEYYPFYDETRINYALGGALKTCIPSDTQEMETKLREFVREQFNPGDYVDLKRSSQVAFGNIDDTVSHKDNGVSANTNHGLGKRAKTSDIRTQRTVLCKDEISGVNGVTDLPNKACPNTKRSKKRKVTFADV